MPEHISKEKNLNFDNSSNKSDLGSIQKFSKSSDNLQYHQNLANSSLKVSQLQKLQDTANKNVLQRVVPNDAVTGQNLLKWNQDQVDRLNPDERALSPVNTFLSSEYIEKHLDEFDQEGAGKFDHPEGFDKIGKEFDWGRGLGQFFGRLDEQREVAKKAKSEMVFGLFPKNQLSLQCTLQINILSRLRMKNWKVKANLNLMIVTK